MADKKKNAEKDKAAAKAPVKKRSRRLLKATLLLLVLLMLAGGSLAVAIYFKLFDPDAVAAQYKLYDYPLIGGYFTKPATNFETVDLPPDNQAAKDNPAAAPAVQTAAAAPVPAATAEADLKANLAKTKQEETKRLSRLARLYGEMKPDEAVPILNQLDDPTVLAIFGKMDDSQVAKIMSLFDARRAARLTQDMLKGKTM